MKKQAAVTLIMVLFLGVTLSVSQAYAMKGYGKAIETTASMKETKSMLQDGLNRLEKTMRPLNELTIGKGDLRKKYEMFSGELKNLQAKADDVRKLATKMWARGDAYFTKWDAEIEKLESESVKKIGQERKNDIAQKFEGIKNAMKDLKAAFTPYQANLKDIDTYLATDLSTSSIESMSTLIQQANDEAKVVREKVNAAIAELDQVSTMISPK